MTDFLPLANWALALVLSPLLLGIINRVKAFFGGRRGQPVLQAYYDLTKLLHKGAVYSNTVTWVFKMGAAASLAGPVVILMILPLGKIPGAVSFQGDMILMVFILASVRFLTVLGALDTGSPFEGMGASREAQFSILTETAFILCLAAISSASDSFSLSSAYASFSSVTPVSVMISAALLMILLAENARIPVDDPNTHLELTMIHEAMVLDHCGIDLCFIQYGAALKLWIFSALFSGVFLPLAGSTLIESFLFGLAGVFATALLVGIVESTTARIKLLSLPRMLSLASVLALTAFLWELLQ